jgi:hypothetical protein
VTAAHLVIGGLEIAQCLAIWMLGCDLLKLKSRVDQTELDNEREDADERLLHAENVQLREELDGIHLGLKKLARHLPKENLTSWRDDMDRTVAGVPSPLPEPGATQVFSPGTPRLPSFDLADHSDCGASAGQVCKWAPTGECLGCRDRRRDTIIEGIWGKS